VGLLFYKGNEMIRSTINATIKTIVRSGMAGQSIETYENAAGATAEIDEAGWDAAGTGSVVHSNEHWDGTTKTA